MTTAAEMIKRRDYQSALAEYDAAIKMNPKSATAYFNRSIVKQRLNDQEGAKADDKRAKELFMGKD
ncbi:MAG: tetratricopeptide repeat protein [Candidatus Caenarcaniphilales bacterium]|nr:tetratricopeptide repeat protein [Candidatus Caenarcaniphilales bacterium]